ncbi:outer membrane beta-barrel protein [Dyella marensis]|uniref:OmpA-OmpF porin, OOP family n=1 Tax=Dyella marensis TaxID=500610 RepID=A0A1I2K0J2_9GAMM|nr:MULTISPECIES: outer membrane beta-barrel protein [Dyella]SFF58516.1 OmpA-OmpF porin, OOP family [Dyella marensis]
MNKLLCSAVLAAAALSPFAAQADDAAAGSNQLNNFFVTGNLGQSNYRVGGLNDKSDVFQSVRFGWRWNNIVGAEAGYTSLGQAKQYVGTTTIGVEPKAAIIGVNAKYDFYGSWFVSGHGGYLRSRTVGSITIGDVRTTEKSWNNGWYAGVGVGYNVTDNVALALNYDNYHVKYGRGGSDQPQTNGTVAAYSASIEYRF